MTSHATRRSHDAAAPPPRTVRAGASAFTLIELMIAIALVLLLMIGINLVFQMTSRAVGAGQALSESVRNNQAIQSVMYRDFTNAAMDDGPFIVLYSRNQPAFRNRADQQTDRDYDPTAPALNQYQKMLTIDLDEDTQEGEQAGNGTPPAPAGEIISPFTYNNRNHRVDILVFFARDRFSRQTGNDGTYVADQSSLEAMIWYGHLAQFRGGSLIHNDALYTAPGQLPVGSLSSSVPTAYNPNNLYATQWILGRQAILLQDEDSGGIKDANGVPQNYIDRPDWDGASSPPNLNPLAFGALSTTITPNSGSFTIQNSRYDLAATTFDDYRKRLTKWTGTPEWYEQMMSHDLPDSAGSVIAGTRRFRVDAQFAKPIDSEKMARIAPVFVPACSQFIVEYAGDFLKQRQSDGLVEAALPDGEIDFVRVGPNGPKKVRWYGMPRNVETIDDGANGPVIHGNGGAPTQYIDVVPFRDVVGSISPNNYTFEPNLPFARVANYADPSSGGPNPFRVYRSHWGPADKIRPSMFRITIVLDDPNARLTEPQAFEYVFKVK